MAVPLAAIAAEAAAPTIASGLGSLGLSEQAAAALAPAVFDVGASAAKKLIKPLGNKLFGRKKKRHARKVMKDAAKVAGTAAQVAADPTVQAATQLAAGHLGVDPALIAQGGRVAAQVAPALGSYGVTKKSSELDRIQKIATEALEFHDLLSAFNAPSADEFTVGQTSGQ
jgi:hypothetical protein